MSKTLRNVFTNLRDYLCKICPAITEEKALATIYN